MCAREGMVFALVVPGRGQNVKSCIKLADNCATKPFLNINCAAEVIVQNMAGEIFVHACHILKRAETCLVASQNIYY